MTERNQEVIVCYLHTLRQHLPGQRDRQTQFLLLRLLRTAAFKVVCWHFGGWRSDIARNEQHALSKRFHTVPLLQCTSHDVMWITLMLPCTLSHTRKAEKYSEQKLWLSRLVYFTLSHFRVKWGSFILCTSWSESLDETLGRTNRPQHYSFSLCSSCRKSYNIPSYNKTCFYNSTCALKAEGKNRWNTSCKIPTFMKLHANQNSFEKHENPRDRS